MSATMSVALEALQVGDATCLYRPENQATSLVNATAAEIIAKLASGRDEHDIARDLAARHAVPLDAAIEHVTRLHKHARGCGLLGALARHLEPPASLQGPVAIRGGSRQYAVNTARSALVTIEDLQLRELVEAALAPLATARQSAPSSIVHAVSAHDGFSVFFDGRTVVRDAALPLARRAILQSTLMATQPQGQVAAILHASAVSMDTRAVVLAGPTGSGKTTLMLALLQGGSRFVADDFTPLASDGMSVMPFPVAASVKSGSWSAASSGFPQIDRAKTFTFGARSVRYLDLTEQRCGSDALATAIVCPRFTPGAPAVLEPLRPEAALRALVDCGSEPVGSSPSMRSLVSLATHCPAWSLTYSDTRQAVACVERLLLQ